MLDSLQARRGKQAKGKLVLDAEFASILRGLLVTPAGAASPPRGEDVQERVGAVAGQGRLVCWGGTHAVPIHLARSVDGSPS